MAFALVCIIPLSTVWFITLSDSRPTRARVLSALLVANVLFLIAPVVYGMVVYGVEEVFSAPASGILWLYVVVMPLAFLIQALLGAVKLFFHFRSKK
jgi:hypothetical protein